MITLLSTSDTDLLCAHTSGAEYRLGNPRHLDAAGVAELARGSDVVVYRQLGGRHEIAEHLSAISDLGIPLVVVSGEQAPDADLMSASTVPAGVARQAHDYLAYGGTPNLVQLWAFLCDTILLTGHGFDPPAELPAWGRPARSWDSPPDAPRVAVVYYRAQQLAGNTAYVETLCEAMVDAGVAPVPVYCSSLRTPPEGLMDLLGTVDAAVVTVLAAGGVTPAQAVAGGDDEAWDVAHLAALDIPVIQGLCLTSDRDEWEASDEGMVPLDVATQVAVPEFDGRIITVPFSFKHTGDDGLARYVPDAERCDRVAGIAARWSRLRHTARADLRLCVMLSAYPTKHARIGNAVGLDTAASVVALLRALRSQGYDLGEETVPGLDTEHPDDLVHALIDAGGQDPDWLTGAQLAANPNRIPAQRWKSWFADLDPALGEAVVRAWGQAPGELYVDRGPDAVRRDPEGEICVAGLCFGKVLVMVQPPRGFGENPVAIYHDPDLAPSHHYLAAYRWLREPESAGGFGAHAVVHVGKHGNLEWLPGKNVGLSAACGPDAAIGDLPLIYPFLVNDPGEGTQAKRRAHAVLVDHLVPPMARAESYGDIARLEQLLDEHANISSMDPAKLPAIRQQIWTLVSAAKMNRELGWAERPDEDEFDEQLLHVDGWLCEIKDVQIRDGLHVLGSAPAGEQLIDLVTAMVRARRLWGGERSVPGLREALGLDEGEGSRTEVDAAEAVARSLISRLAAHDFDAGAVDSALAEVGLPDGADLDVVRDTAVFACTEIVPRLAATTGEITRTLHALRGGYVPAGPSGSPLRGLVNVLPTGRNFYSVDPRALPSELAWETGVLMAESLVERHRADTGEYPRSVGLSVWGTSAMRTSGDDVAEVFALLGVRPEWDPASRRIVELAPIPLGELSRPRIDVTVRISGFFRDAFPHVLGLLDDAVRMVAELDEPDEQNFVRAHVRADRAAGVGERQASVRVFGSKPGTYGAGILQLVDSGTWRDDADLAAVYTEWGGYAYGRGLDGVAAGEDMNRAYRRIQVAAKNIDSVEHDILDSDDYYQYHGGMVATVRALTGADPRSYVGDSTAPDRVRTRSLVEETGRIVRARVVNPRWISAMRRHGYKGAFEMAATVDYLFGWDATTGVVDDWMYEQVSRSYVLDGENRAFLTDANPWALHAMSERLLEAADRGLWADPDPEVLDGIRSAFLEAEGGLEDR